MTFSHFKHEVSDCSQAHMVTCVLGSSMSQLQRHLCGCKRVRFQVIHVIAMLVLAAPSLSHSLPQHEAPPGQHDLLQEHSTHPAQLLHHDLLREPQAHPAQLQTFTRLERIAASPLCDNEIQSGRTLRTTHSTASEQQCCIEIAPISRFSAQVMSPLFLLSPCSRMHFSATVWYGETQHMDLECSVCQGAFRSNSVVRRLLLRVAKSLGLPVLTVLQTHCVKATVLH